MSEQGTLFSETTNAKTGRTRFACTPILAANGDAETSHAAAAELVASGAHGRKCREALAILAAWTGEPPTCVELSAGNAARRYMLAKRLADCAKPGREWAAAVGERRCRVTGNVAQVWAMTAAGRDALRLAQ